MEAGAHVDAPDKQGSQGAVCGHVEGVGELPEALPEPEHEGGLAVLLEASQRQGEELAAFYTLLEALPLPHGPTSMEPDPGRHVRCLPVGGVSVSRV